jgi:hypothetical protein
MLRGEDRPHRAQFSLLYALLFVTNTCILLGSWSLSESRMAPDWALPYCGAGILGGLYGYLALAVFHFVRD